MDSFYNPIQPPDPYDNYRVEGVEEEHKKEPGGGKWGEKPPKWGIAAYFLNLLKKVVDQFIESSSGANTEMAKVLRLLKQSFDTLKKEDRSEDVNFLNNLAQIWQDFLEASLKQTEPTFKVLMKKIQHYPEHQEHTFGYYLTEHVGQKWIPFPYMEMIQQIHSEYNKNPQGSALTEWTSLIDQLLSKIK